MEEADFQSPHIKEIPKDDNGYCVSFDQSQHTEILNFWNDYGFVVIKDALTQDQCKQAVDDVWEYIEQEKFKNPERRKLLVKRDDPTTWEYEKGWDSGMANEGIIGMRPVYTKTAFELRQNKVLYDIGNLLQGQQDGTIVSVDRYGCFRPNKLGIKGLSNSWETMFNVHIDLVEKFWLEDILY